MKTLMCLSFVQRFMIYYRLFNQSPTCTTHCDSFSSRILSFAPPRPVQITIYSLGTTSCSGTPSQKSNLCCIHMLLIEHCTEGAIRDVPPLFCSGLGANGLSDGTEIKHQTLTGKTENNQTQTNQTEMTEETQMNVLALCESCRQCCFCLRAPRCWFSSVVCIHWFVNVLPDGERCQRHRKEDLGFCVFSS